MKLYNRSEEIPFQEQSSLEGVDVKPGVKLRALIIGSQNMAIEVFTKAGHSAPPHTHDHESLIYVISGKIRVTVDKEVFEVGPGDTCIHPLGSLHFSEALLDSHWLEFKNSTKIPWKNIANKQ